MSRSPGQPPTDDPHRVVIVGSGFGGLFAAKALARAPVRVTVVDQVNHHLFQPLLYQVATGILSSGEIAPATRDVLRRQDNADVQLGCVVGVDAAARRLSVRRPDGRTDELGYDSAILAGGVTQSYFGHDEFRDLAPGMKSIDDALQLRGRIFGAFEMAELESDPQRRRAWLTFAIIGGGPTGVELAGQIGELARRSLRGNFRSFAPAEARIVLFDGGERVLASFTKRQSARAAKVLAALGVECNLRSQVVGVDAGGITVRQRSGEETRVEAMTRIWAAGVQAPALAGLVAEATGASSDRRGRIQVAPDCSVPGHPELFVVGDMMALDDLPGLAEVAMQTGRHAARTVAARAAGRPEPGAFHYRDLGSMAAVSRTSAVASFRRLHLSGRLGWLTWLVIHLLFLTGFKNRVTTVVHWGITFVGRGRAERAITSRQAGEGWAEAGPGPGPGTSIA